MSRYGKIRSQLNAVLRQKNEISQLYGEVAAGEEELRQQNEQLHFLAYYDTLTGLPNRKMIMEHIYALIPACIASDKVFYVVLIDTDDFKKVNDTLGHRMGDRFIEAAAERFKEYIHEGDLLGRIGGDEFALIIERNPDENDVFDYIEKLRERFCEPYQIENVELRMTASFGISVFPKDGTETSELMQCADTAMYKSKDFGKNNAIFFLEDMKEEIVKKTEMEKCLMSAVEKEEFSLAFQPQFHINGEIAGFEALLRWNAGDIGWISPLQFIPLAEETGLIVPLGAWVLKAACRRFKELRDKYNLDAVICVNISPIQVKESHFIQTVEEVLRETGLDPRYLEIEITESVFIGSILQTIFIFEELKKKGVRIALDDFGTGYSSLSYLRMLPIDTLKIDKSFIKDILTDSTHKQIVGDIISLAHNLNINVVAEGIEFGHQLDYLKEHNCDRVQGFLLGRPVGEEDLEKLLSGSEKSAKRTE